MDILPTMYGHFVKIFREKRSGGSRDTYRLVESGFMVEAYNILNKASLHSNRLYCLQKLMHEALTLNTYVASNDDVSRKQFSSLDRMTEYAVNQLSNGDGTWFVWENGACRYEHIHWWNILRQDTGRCIPSTWYGFANRLFAAGTQNVCLVALFA